MYLDNCWYAAGWSDDLEDGFLDQTICEERILAFRRGDGGVAALSGICPHRFASLARGARLPDDQVRCPYHGLIFAADGQCLGGPYGPPPRRLALKTFPAVERHGLVWIWRGHAEQADPALIPDFAVLEAPDHRVIRGAIRAQANHQLITDNLMDLTHVAVLHEGGIGGDAVVGGQHSVQVSGTTIYSDLWCADRPPSPVWKALFNDYPKNVDHWLDMRWDAPGHLLLDVGVAPVDADRQGGIQQWGANILTPVSETETLYFWASARAFARDDSAVDAAIRAAVHQAFAHEDKPMLEDVQRNMGGRSFEEMRPVIMALDKGAIWARRTLADLTTGKRRLEPTRPRPVAEAAGVPA